MKTITYTVANAEVANAVCAECDIKRFPSIPAIDNQGRFDGRTIRRIGDLEFELSGGNITHDKFSRFLRSVSPREETAPAPVDGAATPKQIAYLRSLIARDPGAATTIGASRDGANPVEGLTKARASHFIDTLIAGV